MSRATALRALLGLTTVITFGALGVVLLSGQGWQSELRWILVGSAALLVVVSWMQAAALARRGHDQAAAVLLAYTPVFTTYLLIFAAVLAHW